MLLINCHILGDNSDLYYRQIITAKLLPPNSILRQIFLEYFGVLAVCFYNVKFKAFSIIIIRVAVRNAAVL